MKLVSNFTVGKQVTRQDLYDAWAQATAGNITQDEFAEGTVDIIVSTNPTDADTPGQMWFDQNEQVWRGWIDMTDDTGCSLWCAIGPDKFEEPMLATEPIPARAVVCVDATVGNRAVKLPPGFDLKPLGVVGVSGEDSTTASGTWFRVITDGFCKFWHSVAPNDSSFSASRGNITPAMMLMPATYAPGAIGPANAVGTNFVHMLGMASQGAAYGSNATDASINHSYIEGIFTGIRYKNS